jgi:Flp pilus assembly protein TadD
LHRSPHLRRTRFALKIYLPSLVSALCLIGIGTGLTAADVRSATDQEVAAGPPHGPLLDARKLLALGRVQEAESAVRSYLAEHQTSADAHFLLGLILFRKIQTEAPGGGGSTGGGNGSESGPAARKLREENAKASLAEYTEGAKYQRPTASDLKIVALNYVLLGSYADASKWLTRSVDENPQDAEAWYYLGRSKYNENRFEEAIQAFTRCLVLEPRNVKAQSNLGLSYAGLNRIAEAQAAFLQAIEWQSDAPRKDPEAYIGLGDLLVQQNRASEAATYLQQAVQIAPRESRAREKLASAYLNLNNLSEAQTQLEAAAAFDSQNPNLHYLLGTLYRRQGQAEKAKAEFERFQSLKERTGTGRP